MTPSPAEADDHSGPNAQPRAHVIGAANAALEHISELAPKLKEAELRVLLYLSADAIAKGGNNTRRSSREIATATKSARRAIVKALDSLRERGVITTREGSATAAAEHALPFLEVQKMGGAFRTPHPLRGGAAKAPPLGPQEHHRGAAGTPPAAENTSPPSALDITPDQLETLDRALTARPEEYERGKLGEVRSRIQWFHEKHGSREHAPDAQMCAGILAACGSTEGLDWLCIELHNGRQTGGGGAWWRAVALQRINGIPAKATSQRVAEWKNHRRPKIVAPTTAPEPRAIEANPPAEKEERPEETDNWTQQIAAVAAGKRF